jgi:hypothetical protein
MRDIDNVYQNIDEGLQIDDRQGFTAGGRGPVVGHFGPVAALGRTPGRK